jgi:hypothetical protein
MEGVTYLADAEAPLVTILAPTLAEEVEEAELEELEGEAIEGEEGEGAEGEAAEESDEA